MRPQIAGAQAQIQVNPTVSVQIELVVPFTTPELTRAALTTAERYSIGLNAAVRLIKVLVVPFPNELEYPAIAIPFLREQLGSFECALPVKAELYSAREEQATILRLTHAGSVVLIASKKRPWLTREERLASALRKAGTRVVVTYPKSK